MEVENQQGFEDGAVEAPSMGDTVSGSEPDRESVVLGMEQWAAVRQRREAGESVSEIARALGIDRKTVRRCLQQEAWRPYVRQVQGPTLLDAHRTWLVERAPQVRYSARVVWQELRSQRGFEGSYELVKLAVRPLRQAAAAASLTQRRFETGPGEQAQVDWGQAMVMMGGARRPVHIFVMILGYSRRGYAEGFCDERMASLLAAHERAFAHFGGCCETLLYDRMRTVTTGDELTPSGERRARFNSTFAAFAQHWGFAPRLCRPYRAQTKGKVESGVKYVKRNFLPGRSFRDLEDFNDQLAAWQADVADVRVHGTTHQRPLDRFADEASVLVATGTQTSFLQSMVRSRVVADDWLVAIDANRYSVPFRLIGQTVEVVREGGCFVIRHQGQVVASHPVLAGRAQLSVRSEHGPGAVARNLRHRYGVRPHETPAPSVERDVEVRDLSIYEQLLDLPEVA